MDLVSKGNFFQLKDAQSKIQTPKNFLNFGKSSIFQEENGVTSPENRLRNTIQSMNMKVEKEKSSDYPRGFVWSMEQVENYLFLAYEN